MPIIRSEEEKAFDTLSIQAKLHIKLEKATSHEEKFSLYIRYATDIGQRKSLDNIDEITNTNLKIVMQLIKSYLDSVHPDRVEKNVLDTAIFEAVTYPELVKLLLEKGANPNFKTDNKETPLHRVVRLFFSLHVENLFRTAELLVAVGANLDAEDENGKKPIDLITNLPFLGEEKIKEIKDRFKQVTEQPREMIEIVNQPMQESPYSYLQLTETDNREIALYKEKLIISDALHVYMRSFSPFFIDRSSDELMSTSIPFFTDRSSYELISTSFTSDSFSQQSILNHVPTSITCEIPTTSAEKPKEAINGTQKNIIEVTLKFIFDDISSKLTSSDEAINALNAILSKSQDEIESLKDVWGGIKQIRDILAHPCPQNRCEGDGNAYWQKVLKGQCPITPEEISSCQSGVNNGIVYYYESRFGSDILTEPQGMLGLTSRNDSSALSVTKEATVNYIQELIKNEIEQHQNKATTTSTITPR